NLVIRKHGRQDVPPLISTKWFHVDANVMGLWRKHVQHVRADGRDGNIAPDKTDSDDKKATTDDETGKKESGQNADGDRHGGMERDVIIDTLDSVDARGIIIPAKEGRKP